MTGKSRNRTGVISLIALVFLALFATIGMSYSVLANSSLMQAGNLANAQSAHLQAESGVSFLNYLLKTCTIPAKAQGSKLLDAVESHLSSQLEGTTNLQGAVVFKHGGTVNVPTISTSAGRAFSAVISLTSDTVVHLAVTGQYGNVSRTVGMDYQIITGDGTPGQPGSGGGGLSFFEYGIASKGKIRLTGRPIIRGANSPEEASVLMDSETDDEGVEMTGTAEIEGDVYLSDPDAYPDLGSNTSIGGENASSGNIDDHIHTGIGSVDFPEVDPSVFEPFVEYTVTKKNQKDETLTNIRIPANTNPTFSGDTTIYGVVFIETPNNVKFTGTLTLIGVVVTEDAGDDNTGSNSIKFAGSTNVQGVESLPAEFEELKQLPGSFLLAPGFEVEFTGNFGAVNGTMAADKFKFSGTAGGVVKGMLINYTDNQMTLTGSADITIDRTDDIARSSGTATEGKPAIPPGFAVSQTFSPLPDSYKEY